MYCVAAFIYTRFLVPIIIKIITLFLQKLGTPYCLLYKNRLLMLLLSIFLSSQSQSTVTMWIPVLGEGMQHGNVPLHGEGERGEHGPDLVDH